MRKLYALLAWLCISLVSIPTIAQQPTTDVANFAFSVDASNNNVVFSNTTIIGDLYGERHAIWTFGDGTSQRTGLHDGTQHHYSTAGTYTVCLKIYRFSNNTNDSVLSAQECKTIVIESLCRANFEFRDSVAHIDPLKHLVRFWAIPFNNSNKPVTQVCWNFGDGSDTCINFSPNIPPTSALAIQHTYYQQGPYNVCVKIKYLDGCIAEKCKSVILQNIPPDECNADFEKVQVISTVNPLRTYFKALPKHNNNKKPAVICWTFGDGTDTCIKYGSDFTGTYAVPHNYKEPGTYEVCVKIQYYGGCEAKKCKSIIISRPDICSADFERVPFNTTNDLLRVYFKALPKHNNNKKPIAICWTFGDGRDTCIKYESSFTGAYAVPHNYKEPGTYEVCVKIQYYGGCESKKCKSITISRPDACSADFERIPVNSTNDPLRIYFKALPKHNNNKKPAAICWTFGDGRDTCIKYEPGFTGTYAVPHKYKEPGTYEVCVKIQYYGGCESKKCKSVTIERPDICGADFERIQSTSNTSVNVYFRALLKHNNNKKPERICWKFGDGKDTCIKYEPGFTGQYVVGHHYQQPGAYEVCVSILYAGGCEAKQCKIIKIGEPDSCKADFETISVASNPLRKYFKAIPSHNHNKKPVYICWKFGDGKDTCVQYSNTQTEPYAVGHTYDHPGQYEVCVRIVYDGGCESKKCKLIQVGEQDNCSADFERSPLQDNNPLTIGLKALPWNNHDKKPSRICWYFGDGKDTCINYTENYTGLYVVGHRYKEPGQYEVCIKILYYGGCESKKCKVITLPPIEHDTCAVRLFEITPSVTSLVRGFFASPSSKPDRRPERICWYFGDGTDTCVMINPQSTNPLSEFYIRHTYPGAGVYKACVKILYQGGCIASDCREVVIRSFTNVCGGYMVDSLAGPRTFVFKGFSVHNPNDQPVSFRWTFGDGSSADGKEVKHTYNVGGDYEVCLYIKTQLGCETKVCKKVRVPGNNEPALHLSPNPVKTVMHVEFHSTHNEQVSIKILNSSGIVVRNYIRNVTVGTNTWDIDLSGLLVGIYSFSLQSPNQLASAIFLKAN
ncbi:MAG: PKD domain-containing protein [Bacteroidota bacterium]